MQDEVRNNKEMFEEIIAEKEEAVDRANNLE